MLSLLHSFHDRSETLIGAPVDRIGRVRLHVAQNLHLYNIVEGDQCLSALMLAEGLLA